jgi:two-component system cell cycle sensor histidine kinase/response regulator CckA
VTGKPRQAELQMDMAGSRAPYSSVLAGGGILMSVLAYLAAGTATGVVLLTSSATLVALGIILLARRLRRQNDDRRLSQALSDFLAHDGIASFAETPDGEIAERNAAAAADFGGNGRTLSEVLGGVVAAPAPILNRLRIVAGRDGVAQEDVVTARGHLRILAHRTGAGGILWRIDGIGERAQGARPGDQIGLPMMVASGAGNVLFMNEALRQLLGARVGTLQAVFTRLPVHGGEIRELQTAAGRRRVLVAEVARPGQRRDLFLIPVPDEMGGRDGAGLGAAAVLPVALLLLARDGTLIEANVAARALIGECVAGTALPDLLDGPGRPVADWIADAVAGRAEGRPEVLRLRRSEADAFLQVTLSRTMTPEGTGLIAILSDATQLKTLEAQFVQSQKMQAIGQLAGGIAHDFNNLLTAIKGHCDLLLLRRSQSDPDYADLMQINHNANRAASLVGQLLAFSRKQTLRPHVLDLREALADLAHLLNRLVGENIRLVLAHDPDLRPIRADRRQLEQVIMNLVVNARDAMAAGGTIQITTANLRLEEELRRDRATVPAGDYVLVSVADEGTGIAPERIEKIFEPFFTTKRQGEGTGLGLSMAYGIVKQTGGFIFCDSRPGEGTTFRLYFPAHTATEAAEPEPDTAPARPSAPAPVRRGNATILLVEDEAPVRAFAARALRMRGYAVFEADCGEAALALLEDASLSFDVFVTDVIMPGLDGPTWVRRALEGRPATRVVFISGYAEDSIAETRDRVPNSVFLPKPFSLAELIRTVQDQLGQDPPAADAGENRETAGTEAAGGGQSSAA